MARIGYGTIAEEQAQANARFIAAARTDVPRLAKALRRALEGDREGALGELGSGKIPLDNRSSLG